MGRKRAISTAKHFLDTTVVHGLLTGATAYREYLNSEIGSGDRLISDYIVMEFRRGFLRHLVEFYSWVDLPMHQTFGEALTTWRHQWGGRLKAVVVLAAQLFEAQRLDPERPSDKQKALLAIARYIKRYELKLRNRFKNTGVDSTRCARATVPMRVSLKNARDDFARFLTAFDDTKACRSRCRIDDVLLERHPDEIRLYTQQASKFPKTGQTRGFVKIGEHLLKIIDRGPEACTCQRCGQIGDAVIALEAPRQARLETSDFSFDHLCPPIAQPFKRHLSELAFVKSDGHGLPAPPRSRRSPS